MKMKRELVAITGGIRLIALRSFALAELIVTVNLVAKRGHGGLEGIQDVDEA